MVQIISHLALLSLAVVSMVSRHAVEKHTVYGYEILELCSALVTWPICLAVLMVRRT